MTFNFWLVMFFACFNFACGYVTKMIIDSNRALRYFNKRNNNER